MIIVEHPNSNIFYLESLHFQHIEKAIREIKPNPINTDPSIFVMNYKSLFIVMRGGHLFCSNPHQTCSKLFNYKSVEVSFSAKEKEIEISVPSFSLLQNVKIGNIKSYAYFPVIKIPQLISESYRIFNLKAFT